MSRRADRVKPVGWRAAPKLSVPNDQYDDNFRLFLGNDLADQGGGHLADT
jgi:hypothetical protein